MYVFDFNNLVRFWYFAMAGYMMYDDMLSVVFFCVRRLLNKECLMLNVWAVVLYQMVECLELLFPLE